MIFQTLNPRSNNFQMVRKLRVTGDKSNLNGTRKVERLQVMERQTEVVQADGAVLRPARVRLFSRRSCWSPCWTRRSRSTPTQTCCRSRRPTWCWTTCTRSRWRTTCWWWRRRRDSDENTRRLFSTNPLNEFNDVSVMKTWSRILKEI